jgi:hypothetical protein
MRSKKIESTAGEAKDTPSKEGLWAALFFIFFNLPPQTVHEQTQAHDISRAVILLDENPHDSRGKPFVDRPPALLLLLRAQFTIFINRPWNKEKKSAGRAC